MASLTSIGNDLRVFAKYHLKRRVFDYPARETELGVVGLGFDGAVFRESLRSLEVRYEVDALAEITYEDRTHVMHRISTPRSSTRRTVLVLAGVHGNEHAGILAVPEILERFEEPSVRLVVIAPVNPVGAAELSRYNGDGYDINRDFVRFDTAEARAVRDVIEQEKPDFVVSLHEGPQDGAFMFLNRHVGGELAVRLADAIERGGATLASRDYFGARLDPPGVAPMGKALWLINRLWARTLQMKATGMWCNDRDIPEITLESSWRGEDRDVRVRAHVDLVGALIREIVDGAE